MSPSQSLRNLPPERLNSILVVDDEAGIRDSLSMFLAREGLDVTEAQSAEEALTLLRRTTFSVVITDISMPGAQDGLDVLRYVREHFDGTEVIMMTGHFDVDYAIEALKCGAFDYFKKPFLFEEIGHSLRKIAERRRLIDRSRELDRLRSRNEATTELQTQTMVSLAAMIDAKNPYTRAHSERVSGYARFLGIELGLSARELRLLVIGGKLHDIGKIGTPEAILTKNGPLNDEEWSIIQEHPVCGYDLLKPLSFMKPYLGIVRSHHERLDGSGYPDALVGDEIPLLVRISSIADVYDAITSNRPYRSPMSLRDARGVLERDAGPRLDANLVDAFFRVLEKKPWAKRQEAVLA